MCMEVPSRGRGGGAGRGSRRAPTPDGSKGGGQRGILQVARACIVGRAGRCQHGRGGDKGGPGPKRSLFERQQAGSPGVDQAGACTCARANAGDGPTQPPNYLWNVCGHTSCTRRTRSARQRRGEAAALRSHPHPHHLSLPPRHPSTASTSPSSHPPAPHPQSAAAWCSTPSRGSCTAGTAPPPWRAPGGGGAGGGGEG